MVVKKERSIVILFYILFYGIFEFIKIGFGTKFFGTS
jgi:hypothetical protein